MDLVGPERRRASDGTNGQIPPGFSTNWRIYKYSIIYLMRIMRMDTVIGLSHQRSLLLLASFSKAEMQPVLKFEPVDNGALPFHRISINGTSGTN